MGSDEVDGLSQNVKLALQRRILAFPGQDQERSGITCLGDAHE